MTDTGSETIIINELRVLKRSRGTMKQKLTLLEKYIDTLKTPSSDELPNINDVELRFDNHSNLLNEFEKVQSILETKCSENELEDHFLEREEFQNRFYKTQSYLKTVLDNLRASVTHAISEVHSNSQSNISNNNIDPLQNMWLPKIKLPIFSGQFQQWINFKNNFNSTITNNKSLNDNQKFQYLKASLEGYAANFIEGIDNTEQPFKKSWELLCERFDKKQFLLDSHFKSLLNVQGVQKETYSNFRKILDEVSKHLTSLDGIGLSKDILYDSFIIHVLSSKLDKNTMRDWKECKFNDDLPSVTEFIDFLKNKADVLQCLDDTQFIRASGSSYQSKHSTYNYKPSAQVNLASNYTCNFCKKNHSIYKCSDFLALPTERKIQEVKKLRLCENCLLLGHNKNNCRSGPCPICKVHKHNKLIHREIVQSTRSVNSVNDRNSLNLLTKEDDNSDPTVSINLVNDRSQVLLSTVLCYVKDKSEQFHACRALLDCGAQMNLITASFCEKLRIPVTSTNCSIIGITQSQSDVNKKCTLDISSRFSDYKSSISCLVVPTITSRIPTYSFDISNMRIPNNIDLADPEFNHSKGIDVLVGANIFWNLLQEGKIQLGKNLPTLVNTKFGWIITGTMPIKLDKYICTLGKVHVAEDDQLKKFWEIEEVQCKNQFMSHEDTICESLFERDTYRAENGQFVVKFPLKHSVELLGDTKVSAMKRFKALEHKFSDSTFKQLYHDFIHEYQDLGHMRKVSNNIDSNLGYYLPHHGVLKATSITTKLRTVFDGSCQSTTGWSLNDIQYVGPKVQNDIFDILVRFRMYAFVVSADISKMYRQILMHPEHRHLQRILWRDSPNDEFSVFELNTVTYGTRAAPYLAIKCIKTLATQNWKEFSEASNTILSDMYVDDLLTGSNDLNELQDRCKNIYNILESANFILRKWTSNNQQVVSNFAKTDISNSILNIGDQESSKTLGVQWNNSSDTLKYTIKQFSTNVSPTKRSILSTIAHIYDPLGLLSPSIILAKILIKRLWSLHISWDAPVPPDILKNWSQFQNSLESLNHLSIPRNVVSEVMLDIHCFCDASQDAYAACIYLRSTDKSGIYTINLLCSKSKVSPLKAITIPKLELCACLLGAQLTKHVVNSLKVDIPIHMWSDSQVALSWIHHEPSDLQVFVANRVSKIQSLSNIANWKYVNGSSNPADLASRGVPPDKLISSVFWWKGPAFLQLPISDWPSEDFILKKSELIELKKKTAVLHATPSYSFDLLIRFSTLTRLVRVTAYCLRFCNNLKNKTHRKTSVLSASELENARAILIRQVQQDSFFEELKILKKNKTLPNKHKLSSLAPFVDEQGIIRVGGRLKNTYLPFSTKHPILLSSTHHFTKLVFEHKHRQLLHPGPQLLLSSVRQFYWPIKGRILAKQIVKNCITCVKFNPVPFTAPMSNLPNERIKPQLPFQVTGIDYAGPFFILNKKGRGSRLTKCYLAVFICFCTKAIHLEVVSDLTTDNFLASFKRFSSRRGVPSVIYSDNGSTFVGANNKLKELGHFLSKNCNQINDELISQFNIKWIFIPPYTPNHGGLWEAAVKMAKHHLKRVLINKNVTFDEFNTLIIQIEGILNSRPLFDMSNDPNDPSPLTPSHFLIGRTITSVPNHDLTNLPVNRLSRLQHIQQLYQQFWRQFSKQYISQLHQSYKWKNAPSQINLDTLVLIKNDAQPPCIWPTGRITRLFPGRDGVSRIAEVTTSKGPIVRSVRHLYPLPVQTDICI